MNNYKAQITDVHFFSKTDVGYTNFLPPQMGFRCKNNTKTCVETNHVMTWINLLITIMPEGKLKKDNYQSRTRYKSLLQPVR